LGTAQHPAAEKPRPLLIFRSGPAADLRSLKNDTVRARSQQPKLTVKLQLSVGPAATNHQKSFASCGGHEP
jgi:hypothetical protein